MTITNKIVKKIKDYAELVMFSHFIFSIPFALMSMLWAIEYSTVNNKNMYLSVNLFIWIFICLFTARNGANAFNRYADSEIDFMNKRTASRQIPSGRLNKNEALKLTLVLFLMFEISAYQINYICFLLSPIALLIFIAYSYSKRFTWLCHLILGFACGGAPVGAWLAITGELSIIPFFIALGVMFWVSGFDILYATQDIEFDSNNDIYSIPSTFGLKNSLIISSVFHILSIIFLTAIYFFNLAGLIYLVGLLVCSILLVIEHIVVKPDKESLMKWVSYHINQIVAIVFFVFALADYIYLCRGYYNG